MAVDNFPTQFDKMTTTKDRLESRTLTARMSLNVARLEMFRALLHVFFSLWAIIQIIWAMCYVLFFGLGAVIARIRLAVHRRRIAKALLKQYHV